MKREVILKKSALIFRSPMQEVRISTRKFKIAALLYEIEQGRKPKIKNLKRTVQEINELVNIFAFQGPEGEEFLNWMFETLLSQEDIAKPILIYASMEGDMLERWEIKKEGTWKTKRN